MDMQLRDARSDADRVCIIGAGSSGLAAAKTFSERGIRFDCLERENDIEGLWNETTETGVVYDTTYLVSSRRYTGFEDYPMPEDYPTSPRRAARWLLRGFGPMASASFRRWGRTKTSAHSAARAKKASALTS